MGAAAADPSQQDLNELQLQTATSSAMPGSQAMLTPLQLPSAVPPQVTAPTTDQPTTTDQPPTTDQPFQITDYTKQAGFGNKFGNFATAPNGMIIHHTAGGSNINDTIRTFQQRGLPSQFVIDRNGQVYRTLPQGAIGQHIQDGWGPVGQGKNNTNMEGVEIIANNNGDVLPVQQQAAAKLVWDQAHQYGWKDPTKVVFGHGEVNPGHKEPDEGMAVVNGIRNGTLKGTPDQIAALASMPDRPTIPTVATARAGDPSGAFISTYGPYAKQAGDALGIDPNIILSQWGMESGWGKRGDAAAIGNMAGIKDTKGNYIKYNSPQEFASGYIDRLRNPRYAKALNSGKNLDQFVDALGEGGYYGATPDAYRTAMRGSYATIAQYSGNPLVAPPATITAPDGTTASTPIQLADTSAPTPAPTTRNPLALPAPADPMDMRKLVSLAMMRSMLGSGMGFRRIAYNPWVVRKAGEQSGVQIPGSERITGLPGVFQAARIGSEPARAATSPGEIMAIQASRGREPPRR